MSEKKGIKKPFGYHSSTSITISKRYVDYITGERKDVTEEHLKLMEEALTRKSYFHLIMSGIDRVLTEKVEGPPTMEEDLIKQLNMGINYMENMLSAFVDKKVQKSIREIERTKKRRDL